MPELGCFLYTKMTESNNDGHGYQNVTQKVNSPCFKLYRAYSISFNSPNVAIKVQEKKKKVVVLCSRPR